METKRARAIVEEAISILERKNKDYSGGTGDNISATGLAGMATRLTDKVSRLRSLVNKPAGEVNFESIEDTLLDILNYSIIARMVEEGSWGKTTMVYLAGPIDDVSAPDAVGWRQTTIKMLAERKINAFNPVLAYGISKMDKHAMQQIAAIDRNAIKECDVVIANLDEKGLAFGTIREIEYARSLGKRVIVVHPKPLLSAFAHDVEVVVDLTDAVSRLKD